MGSARAHAPPRQRDVQALGGHLCGQGFPLQRLAAAFNVLLNRFLGFVDRLTLPGPFISRQPTEPLHTLRKRTLLAQVAHTHLVERLKVAGLGNGLPGVSDKLFEVLHGRVSGFDALIPSLSAVLRRSKAAL